LAPLVREKAAFYKDNRIIKQLSECALQYQCFTAQNIFYKRWEGGIPVSPVCNARCLGCISLQPAECCPSPQSRIDFTPTIKGLSALDRVVKGSLPWQLKLWRKQLLAFAGKPPAGPLT